MVMYSFDPYRALRTLHTGCTYVLHTIGTNQACYGHVIQITLQTSQTLHPYHVRDAIHRHIHVTLLTRHTRDRSPYLGPGRGVPLEARPLEAGALIFGPLLGAARLPVQDQELAATDAHALDDPALDAAAASGVTLHTVRTCYRPNLHSAEMAHTWRVGFTGDGRVTLMFLRCRFLA